MRISYLKWRISGNINVSTFCQRNVFPYPRYPARIFIWRQIENWFQPLLCNLVYVTYTESMHNCRFHWMHAKPLSWYYISINHKSLFAVSFYAPFVKRSFFSLAQLIVFSANTRKHYFLSCVINNIFYTRIKFPLPLSRGLINADII